MSKESRTSKDDLKRTPSQTIAGRNRVEELAEEYAALKRAGQPVSIHQYTKEYPELADEIRELFPMMDVLDRAIGSPQKKEKTKDSSGEIGPGSRLGEYQLIKPIGRGGMGVVYQAKHVVLGSSAAVKLLPAGMDRPKLRERFQREASAAARMHHPNIVRVFDYGVHGETLYYVMELVEGCGLNQIIAPAKATEKTSPAATSPISHNVEPRTIRDLEPTQVFEHTHSNNGSGIDTESDLETSPSDSHIDRSKFTTSNSGHDSLWNWVGRIGVQAADALDYAHSAGVIHRDIKPGNLMIDTDEKIHVMDFGLAKVADDHTLTATGDLLGTLRYMPPESFSGRADHRSDIYSLGLTLYELLVNQPAFSDVDRSKLIQAISNGQIGALRKELPRIPRDLETIIHKSIATEPSERYESAAEFRDDLTRFLKGEPVQARRPSLIYKTARWIDRNRMVSGLAAAVLVLAAIATIVVSISENRKNFADLQQQLAGEKQQLADERKQSADRIASVFNRFLRGYDASFYNMDDTISREQLLDDATALLDTEFEKDPLVEAKLRITVGTAYLWDDNTDIVRKGQSHLERAVELFKKNGGDRSELAQALTSLARARCYIGLPDESNPLGFTDRKGLRKIIQEAHEIREELAQSNVDWAETLEVKALVLTIVEFDSSSDRRRLAQQGLKLLENEQTLKGIRTKALLYQRLSMAEFSDENYEKAEAYCRKAMALSSKLDNYLIRFQGLLLGRLQICQGKIAEAEITFKESLSESPHAMWPRVVMAISLQGDWQRALEWMDRTTGKLEMDSWQGHQSRRLIGQYLRLSGDDERATQVLMETVQKMKRQRDPDSAQQLMEFMKTSYYLARIPLFSEEKLLRGFAIRMLKSVRDELDPTDPSSSSTIRLAYAISISQFPDLSEEDVALLDRCIELVEEEYQLIQDPKSRLEIEMANELLLAKALVCNAKGERFDAIVWMKQQIESFNGRDNFQLGTTFRNPAVQVPTLRIAEDLLVRWLCEDGKPEEAVAIMRDAVKRRKAIEYPSQHLINFANARLGRLLLKVDRKEEAREELSKLSETIGDSPDCFKWLERRVKADLNKAKS